MGDSTGGFEMVSTLVIDEKFRKSDIRFRNIDQFENYIDSIDYGYGSGNANFNG